jgi:hypothetical protein
LTSPWLSRNDAITLTGSSKLADALMSLIELIPQSWTDVVRRKLREPFLYDEWVVDKDQCETIPFYVYKIVEVFPGKLRCTSYLCHFADGRLPNSSTHQNSVILRKSQVTKACILSFKNNQPNATNALHRYYCGNYASSKLLLSRLNCPLDGKVLQFSNFSVGGIYRAMIQSKNYVIPMAERWSEILHVPVMSFWKEMIQYIHDPILS